MANQQKTGILPVLKSDTIFGLNASWNKNIADAKWSKHFDDMLEENPLLVEMLISIKDGSDWIEEDSDVEFAYYYGMVNTYILLKQQAEVDALNQQFTNN